VPQPTPFEKEPHIIFDFLFSATCLGPGDRPFGIDFAQVWTSIPAAECQLISVQML
jgi:hypothetical protein